jgi:hypothetical protein
MRIIFLFNRIAIQYIITIINFLNEQRGSSIKVSARMLYEMAKRYDEWPGKKYEGSSLRGALRGWYNNGVCTEQSWPFNIRKADNNLTPQPKPFTAEELN